MIEFHLETRSGVPTYRQIVQQVRQALQLGILHEGDQLPTVKDVVEQVAINPNTVLKAYRELEHEGLAAGRPGLGTFITRSLAGSSLAAHKALRTVAAALARQGAACRARRRQHRRALREHFRPADRGRRVSAVDAARTRQAVRPAKWALRDCTLDLPAGLGHRTRRRQRCRKSTLLQLIVGLRQPSEGRSRFSADRP